MKNLAILILLAAGITGCSQTNSAGVNANFNTNVQPAGDSAVVSSHSATNGAMPTAAASNGAKSAASAGAGSPMAKPIDVSQMTAAIEKADKNFKAKAGDAKAKNDLAEAYFVRAFALTEAAQYRSALGDFRKGLKLNPNNADAKGMHDQILSIFQSIGREPPKEGEEPAPLPINEGSHPQTNAGGERINFAPGADEATAAGNLKNYDDAKSFVVKVNAGQTLKTEQAKDEKSLHYVTVSVKDPSGNPVGDADASCNSRREITPTVAGDYILQVVECKKADAWRGDFQLKVSVR